MAEAGEILRIQLLRNSLSTLLRVILSTIMGLLLPPLIIARMGLDTFGVWGLILLINAYVVFLDLGLESSLIKYVADAYAENDTEQINVLFSLTMTLYVLIFGFGLLVALAGADTVASILIGSKDVLQFQWIVQFYIIVAFGNLLVIPFVSVLKGLQLYDRSNLIEILASFVNAIASIIGLVVGWGIASLLFGVMFAMLLRLGAYVYYARCHLPTLAWRRVGWNDLKLFRTLFFLSPADLSYRVYSVITQSIIRLSLSTYGGLTAVGAYEIAKRVVSQLSGVSTTIFTPMLPTVSVLARQERRDTLSQLLEKSLSYLSMVSIPILVFMLFHYEPIMRAWLGIEDVDVVAMAGRLLLLATCIDLFTGPVTTAAVGMGTARISVVKLIGPLLAYVALVPLLGKAYGFVGILVGETIALIIGTFIGLYTFKRWTSIPVLSMAIKSAGQVFLAVIPSTAVIWLLWQWSFWWSGWQNLLVWGGMFAIYLVLTAVIFRIVGILSPYEINLVMALFQRSPNRASSL